MNKLTLLTLVAVMVVLFTVTGGAALASPNVASALQKMITYYTVNDGTSFIRSTSPFSSGVATQVDNPDGSVTLNISHAPGYADSGFVIYAGRLGDLNEILVGGTGSVYSLNLWFDTNNDGEFFSWNGNGVLILPPSEPYGLGPTSQNGALAVDGGTQFYMIPSGQSPTLAQLKSGTVSGINADTRIAIWVGVIPGSGGSASATVTSLAVIAFGTCSIAVDPGTNTITLLADCTTDHTLFVPDGWTLDGANHTVTAVDPVGGHFLGAVVKNGGASAYVKNLTVTASGLANVCDGGDDRLRGILFDDASGSILNNTVIHINQGTSGCQEGNGIEVRNFSSTIQRNVTIDGNTVADYQKNGITANGTVAAVITNNLVTGAGPVDYIAQNGIQVGFGATAKVTGNTSNANNYTPKSYVACGILYYQAAGVKASSNILFANERDVCNFGKGGGQFNPAP